MNEYYNVSFVFDDIFYLQFMQLAIVLYKVRRNNQWSLQINLNIFFWFFIYFLFLYLFEIAWYSQDKCIYWELPSSSVLDHNIYECHFQVSERTYSHFIEIRKYAKISFFLQMAENLKSSYQFKHVFTLPCQKSASFSGVQKDL